MIQHANLSIILDNGMSRNIRGLKFNQPNTNHNIIATYFLAMGYESNKAFPSKLQRSQEEKGEMLSSACRQ
jgi:hypothetical protein